MRIAVFILSSVVGAAAAAPAYLDADSEMEALTMAAGEIGRTDNLRKTCSDEIPDLKPSFGKAALFWRIANKTEIQAVMSFRSGPESRRVFDASVATSVAASNAAFAALPADTRKKACFGFLALAKEQNQRISDRTPRVSSYAAEYLKRKPLSDQALEEYDYLMGCAKQSANRGFDYEKADLSCHCQWRSFSEGLTKAERAKFYELTSDPKALLNWPAARKAMESTAACVRKHLG